MEMWEKKWQLDCLEVQGASWCPCFSFSLAEEKWERKKVCDTKTKFAIAVDWQEIHSVPLQKNQKQTVLYTTSMMEHELIQAKDSLRWGHVVSTSHWSKWDWIYIVLILKHFTKPLLDFNPLQKGILLVKVPLKRAPLACRLSACLKETVWAPRGRC